MNKAEFQRLVGILERIAIALESINDATVDVDVDRADGGLGSQAAIAIVELNKKR